MKFFRGKLIVFSGIDGAGKSTQIDLLLKFLRQSGSKSIYLWTRGGYTGLFNFLKTCLRRLMGHRVIPSGRTEEHKRAFGNPLIRKLWLLIAILDLILVYGLYIRICRMVGYVVIADRYLRDTRIDFRLNFPEEDIDHWMLWKLLEWITPKPDAAFLLLIEVEECLRRSELKNEPFPDSVDVLKKRLFLYKSLAGQMQVIDCMKSIDAIHDEIITHVSNENKYSVGS